MTKVKATILTKRVVKSFWGKKKYMLGLQFHDVYSTQSGANTKEMRVCYIAYQSLSIGDNVLCPMKMEQRGLKFDYSQPIEKDL